MTKSAAVQTLPSVAIGDIASVVSGMGFPKHMQGSEDGDYPVFKVGEISRAAVAGEVYLRESTHRLTESQRADIGGRVIPKGATVFAKVGAAINLNRRAILAQDSLVDNNVMAIHAADFDERFVYYFMLTVRLGDLSRATAVPSIRKADVVSIAIPYLPLAEQRRIVDALEAVFADLAAGIAALTEARADLDRYRRSVLKAAVQGDLTADWRAAHPDADSAEALLSRVLDERRRRWEEDTLAGYEAKGKTPPKNWREKYKQPEPFSSDETHSLPGDWLRVRMDVLLSSIEAGRSFKCVERRPSGDEIGLVKVSAVSWGEYDEDQSKTCLDESRVNPDYFIQPGDFLFSRANTIDLVGACVIAKHVTRPTMLSDKILRLDIVLVRKEWVLYVLRSRYGRDQIEYLATGNQESMRNIGQRRIRDILVPLPPLAEQAAIVEAVEERLSVADAVGAELDRQLARAERLRRAVLHRAFAGELVPQDPAEVSAAQKPEPDTAEAVTAQVAGKTIVQAQFDF